MTVRSIEPSEFKGIYKRIRKDFSPGEHAPYFVLRRDLETGIQKGLLLLDGGSERAYAVCADACENDYVLISLLAVFEEYRGKGYGPVLLEEIKSAYAAKKGIIVEVEKPEEAKSEEEKTVRLKRIRFYEKAGFCLVPGIRYSIWGVPMHLMVLPGTAPKEEMTADIGRIIYDIYFQLMGPAFIHKMRFKTI